MGHIFETSQKSSAVLKITTEVCESCGRPRCLWDNGFHSTAVDVEGYLAADTILHEVACGAGSPPGGACFEQFAARDFFNFRFADAQAIAITSALLLLFNPLNRYSGPAEGAVAAYKLP